MERIGRLFVLGLFLVLATVGSHVQAAPRATGPFTWSAHCCDFLEPPLCDAGTCVRPTRFAKMTLSSGITVVRLQWLGIKPFNPLNGAGNFTCTGTVDVSVTDGTNTVAATLPTGASDGHGNPGDSNPTSVTFPAGATLELRYTTTYPGTDSTNDTCVLGPGNATVQYVVR